jgi:hypothetical protein
MFKRIAAIALIVFCTSIAWAILGSTIFMRTYSSDSRLKDRVASSWGSPQGQAPPSAGYNQVSEETVSTDSSGTTVIRHQKSQTWIPFPIEKSRVNANLAIDYRRKGLLWYSTYKVKFTGTYDFQRRHARCHLHAALARGSGRL